MAIEISREIIWLLYESYPSPEETRWPSSGPVDSAKGSQERGGWKKWAETVRKCSCRMEKRADLFRPKSSNSPGPQQPVAGLLPVKGSFPVKGRSGGLEDMLGNDGARLNRAISFVPHDGEVAISLPHALG